MWNKLFFDTRCLSYVWTRTLFRKLKQEKCKNPSPVKKCTVYNNIRPVERAFAEIECGVITVFSATLHSQCIYAQNGTFLINAIWCTYEWVRKNMAKYHNGIVLDQQCSFIDVHHHRQTKIVIITSVNKHNCSSVYMSLSKILYGSP